MRHIVLLFFFILFAEALQAQEILDNAATYRAEYTYRYKRDSTMKGYYKDTYYLDICKSGHSYFYSRAKQYKDSISNAWYSEGKSAIDVFENTRTLKNGLGWYVDKRFADGTYSYVTRLIPNLYKADAKLEMPQWELCRDTLTINGYLCHKATAKVAGRDWEAWYTLQIPINDGPWLLWGLPGLILHAKDSNAYFRFTCENVGELAEPYHVLLSADWYRFTTMKMKDLLKAELMCYLDTERFEKLYSGAIGSSYSTPLSKRDYIPLYLMPDVKL